MDKTLLLAPEQTSPLNNIKAVLNSQMPPAFMMKNHFIELIKALMDFASF